MTTLDLYTHYRAHSDLSTRDLHPGIPLPTESRPAVWLHIVDVERFVSLHLTRLADGSPIHQRLATKNLKALLHSLNHSITQPLPHT